MAQAQGFNIGLILGPIEVGVVVASCLFGCAVVQTYVYYKRFLKDNWKIKALVGYEMALQIPHLLCVVATMWTMSTTHYGEPQTLNYLPDSTVAAVILSAPITFPVHVFFVYRLYRLAEDRILPAICLLMAFVRLAFNLTLGITGIQMRNSIEYEQHWSWMITAVLVTTAACDLTIAGALCYHLGAKRQVGIKRTSQLLDQLLLYTLATGLSTSTADLAGAICFWAMPGTYVWTGIYIMESGLYMNSLLAALNSRTIFQQTCSSNGAIELEFARPRSDMATPANSGRIISDDRQRKSQRPIVISVTQEIERSGRKNSIEVLTDSV